MANIERKGQDILSQVAIMTEPLIKHLRELIENTRKRVRLSLAMRQRNCIGM